MPIGLRILDVYLLMSHVQVTTKDDWFLGIKAFQVIPEVCFPLHAIVQALQTVLRIRRITADEVEIVHLKRDDASLMVVLVNTDTVCHAERLVAGEYSRSTIAFLVGIVPIRLIPVEGEVKLSLLHFRFLQTKEVGI